MGKDQDILQCVKDDDHVSLQKLLQKASKQAKNKIKGSHKRLNVNYQDADGMSALHQAALMSNFQMLRTLLDNGAAPGLRDNKGMIALHYAAWQGVPQPVQILLQKGSPVNEQALNGESPLHLACQHGHFDVATQLLNHHADPTICNKALKTPLDLACEFGRNRVVELLIRSNLCQKLLEDSPTDTLDNNRTTCLHLAAKNGHVDIIRTLLQAGMNINRSTLKGTALHEAALTGKIEAVRLLLDCGVDVNKPNSYDQTALDIVQKFTSGHVGKELKHLLKEASCAVYARAVKDYSNVYDPGSLAFKEGDIITVLEQRTDGIWKGYVYHEGRMAKTGMFPANNVVLIDSKVVVQQQQHQHQQHHHRSDQHLSGQVPDLLNRGPSFSNNGSNGSSSSHSTTSNHFYSGSDRGSLESSSTDDSQPSTPYSFPSTPSSNYPPPPSLLNSYPPRSPGYRDTSGADSGFSSSQSLPQHTPSSPSTPQQFGKSPFAVYPVGSTNGNIPHLHVSNGNGYIPEHHHHYHHQQPQHHHGAWPPAPTSLPALGGVGADMRGGSPAKDSPGHSNRNSAASSDSGRGISTGLVDAKPVHNYVNVNVNNNNQQHRLSGQSYESGVSSRQSYHSTSSSSLGSLDRLEEPGFTSTINVAQLFQAGVPDNEVLHAWLHDLHFEEYYPMFQQAGYDMPTISRMTPEDLTAIGITKPAHRKRLKAAIARLNIHDGIPDHKPNDLMEWLHLLGLGAYLDTLCGQGYDNIDYVTDITWEDLEEIGIQKLGHQKKIMLAIDRLKRITTGAKRLSSVDGRTASLELLEPPPPAPPMTGRWSGGEITAIPPHVYDGALGGARPKKSPSGDSISTTGSGNSGSSAGSGAYSSGGGSPGTGGEIRMIPLPREDAGLAGAMPYSHSSTGGGPANMQPDVVAIQVKRNMRSSTSEDKRDSKGQPLMYHSFQGHARRPSDNDVFVDDTDVSGSGYPAPPGAGMVLDKNNKPLAKMSAKSESDNHDNEMTTSYTNSGMVGQKPGLKNNNNNNNPALRVDTGEHIYDMPQVSPSQKSPMPSVMPKPFPDAAGMAGPLHVNTTLDSNVAGQAKPISPGGKGGKKIPPPPPKRTHSIRGETSSISESPQGSPSKAALAPTTITVSASVHPQPTTSKQPPPPVMQKPKKPMSPAVANKLHQQHGNPHHSQQQQQPPQHQQQPLNPPVAQKSQMPLVQAQKVVGPSAVPHPHVHASGGPVQQPPVVSKPMVMAQQPHIQHQQAQQPKSPLPSKSPIVAAAVTAAVQRQQQHGHPHHPPLSQPSHMGGVREQGHIVSSSHSTKLQQQTPQTSSAPSQHLGHSNNPTVQQPQVQAFASCVKSLSEKFGKNNEEDDQFPDNVSTDSDDFPPPPPPIAMDIITPKIHNYGIPTTRDREKDYARPHHHQQDLAHKSHVNPPGARAYGPGGQHDASHQKNIQRPPGHNLQTAVVIGSPAKALPGQNAGLHPHRQQPIMASNSSSPASSDHEHTPEPDSANKISSEKRSESTTSFESNSSSSSVDSNTLPFANENVGTIKQRIGNVKPSIVQPGGIENGQRNVDLNTNLFDNESQRTAAGFSNSSSSSYMSSSSYSHHITSSAAASSSPKNSMYSSSPGHQAAQHHPHHHQHQQHHQQQQQLQQQLQQQQQQKYQQQVSNMSTSSSGAIKPPVPSKKPALSPKPSRPKADSSSPSSQPPPPPQKQHQPPPPPKPAMQQPVPKQSQQQQQMAPPKPALQQQSAPTADGSKQASGNVLSDIDDMLQGLTDELDAMLEEEMAS